VVKAVKVVGNEEVEEMEEGWARNQEPEARSHRLRTSAMVSGGHSLWRRARPKEARIVIPNEERSDDEENQEPGTRNKEPAKG
jgi:hypothetical protein